MHIVLKLLPALDLLLMSAFSWLPLIQAQSNGGTANAQANAQVLYHSFHYPISILAAELYSFPLFTASQKCSAF